MAQATVTLGAPSLTGKDCVELVTTAFKASTYPLAAEVTNLMPRWGSFPEAKGFNIGHVAALGMNVANVTFEDFADICKFADTIAQVADLNGFKEAIQIKAEGTQPEEGDDDEETDADASSVGKAQVGTAKVAAAKAEKAAKSK